LKQYFMEYEVRERYSGKASYNFFKLLKLASSGLFSFSSFPIKVSIFIGILISFINIIFLIIILVRNIMYGIQLPGYLSMITSILFLFSFLFLLLGLIGEYIYKIFMEIKQRPLYIVETHIRKEADNEE